MYRMSRMNILIKLERAFEKLEDGNGCKKTDKMK